MMIFFWVKMFPDLLFAEFLICNLLMVALLARKFDQSEIGCLKLQGKWVPSGKEAKKKHHGVSH